jgi:hypothetical protein
VKEEDQRQHKRDKTRERKRRFDLKKRQKKIRRKSVTPA